MPHVFENAPSARAKCRACTKPIAKGELRFGERVPNPYAEGEMTLWYHPMCAAYKRPEAMLETLEREKDNVPEAATLERAARVTSAQRRLPRIDGAERSPTSQAKCRSCREPIQKGEWRIRLSFYEEGRFAPGGFIHLACRSAYFETTDILAPLLHFSPDLSEEETAELRRACADLTIPEPLPPQS